MMTQAHLDEIDNEADMIIQDMLTEFEAMWNLRPSTEPPLELDPQTISLLMEMEDDESDRLDE